jgi:YD repeat-containing protein
MHYPHTTKDNKGNVIYHKDSCGNECWYEYDSNNNVLHYKESNGYEYWQEYDVNNNPIHYKNSIGYEYWYEYDSNNNLIHQRESNGDEYWNEYDSNNNLIHHKDSNGDEFWYDSDGNELRYNKDMQEEIDRLISWYKKVITKLEADTQSNPVVLARIEAYQEFIFDLQSLATAQDQVKEQIKELKDTLTVCTDNFSCKTFVPLHWELPPYDRQGKGTPIQ